MKRLKKEYDDEVSLKLIHEVVSGYFKIDKLEMFTKTRKREFVIPRQWFHYASYHFNMGSKITLTDIGKYYSYLSREERDHSTVLYSYNCIKDIVSVSKSDRKIKEDIFKIIEKKQEAYLLIELEKKKLESEKGKQVVLCDPCKIISKTISLS